MQIKAQGLLNAAKFIEAEYGRDALGAVVRACSEPVRDRYISAIAINWHPIEEFLEFVQTADKILGDGKGKLIVEIGAAGARANMKGIAVRIAFYIAQPDFFFGSGRGAADCGSWVHGDSASRPECEQLQRSGREAELLRTLSGSWASGWDKAGAVYDEPSEALYAGYCRGN